MKRRKDKITKDNIMKETPEKKEKAVKPKKVKAPKPPKPPKEKKVKEKKVKPVKEKKVKPLKEKKTKIPRESKSAVKTKQPKGSRKLRAKKISTKMLATILPVLVLGMFVLTAVSAFSSKKIIDDEIGKQMNLNLELQKDEIENQMGSASSLARHMAGIVGLTYRNEDLMSYVNFLFSMIYEEDFIYGSGIWFEPYAYDERQKFVGPYVYKMGDSPILTYEYSNINYDYCSKDFYTNITSGDVEVAYTKARYDEILKCALVTCSTPMYNPEGEFIGCVSVDVTLDTLQELVGNIKVGETGHAFLISGDGTFLYAQDEEKILQENITESKDKSLASLGKKMMENESGTASYRKGLTSYTVYYDTVPGLDWKLAIMIEDSELNAPVVSLCVKLVAIAVVVLLVITFVIMSQIATVSKQINRVKNFAKQLAEGNFTVKSLENKRKDELGAMGQSLNDMYGSNRDMISRISDHAQLLNDSSSELKDSAIQLQREFKKIEDLMNQVNNDMTSSSAATEEVNAAVEEVNSSVNLLASETEKSLALSGEIKNRADQIEATSKSAYSYATQLTDEHRVGLERSIQNADVVKSIGDLAEVISEIADQINLLSLNASIEAARAGEQGKGFAVVASEIGKLANQTSAAVNKIRTTIGEVEGAFGSLVGQSRSMLQFVSETVTPDYDTFVNVAKQYGEDAIIIEQFSNDIAEMASNIEVIIQEVSQAIQSVAESSQNTVENSNNIMLSVDVVSDVVTEVSDMSVQQEKIAGELQEVVGKFVLEKKE